MNQNDVRNQLADPLWRLNNLYWIVNKDGVKVRFQPNESQLKYLGDCTSSDIILKARQLGITTLMCIIGLDEAVFLNDYAVGIIAHTLNDANKIFDTKVKYPYDHMPDSIKSRRPARNDRAGMLTFDHGSSIQVATSARSGTLQRLHVSEFGKICSAYPKKAREIVTGAFPAVGKNPKTIESTAEGQEGYFYQYTQEAMRGASDFRFHFYPWWADPSYVADPEIYAPTKEDDAYFERLRIDHKISLKPGQKAWWVKQERLLGGDMKRENPSTPEEAFEQAIEGAYFAAQLAHADKRGNIGRFPYDPKYPVYTAWDLGRNDMTTIWLFQHIGGRWRFIGYIENSGEHISFYARELAAFQRDTGCAWAEHYWPHDGKREDLFLEDGRLAVAEQYDIGNGQKLTPTVIERPRNKMEAIEAARSRFASCDFDEHGCDVGIKRLRHYRKEWDEMREVWKSQPRHDDNSHGADGFMTFACGAVPPSEPRRPRRRSTGWAA